MLSSSPRLSNDHLATLGLLAAPGCALAAIGCSWSLAAVSARLGCCSCYTKQIEVKVKITMPVQPTLV